MKSGQYTMSFTTGGLFHRESVRLTSPYLAFRYWNSVRDKVIAALLFAAVAGPLSAAESRPNILFIVSDDHATRAVSAYGNSLVATPNIDRIAKNGMRFDRAYVGNALCGPSRATMLTGMHSHGNGFYSNDWSPDFGFRWSPADVSPPAAGGRLPNRDSGQVAPLQQPRRFRPLGGAPQCV